MPLDPELDPHFDEAARLNNLDPRLLRAIAIGESGGNPTAVSDQGARGLMQLLPDTAARYGVKDVNDPVQSVYGAARMVNELLTGAEQLKANGRDINPVEYALKGYFGGEEGPQWGPKTAAYPGYIAGKYKGLVDAQPRGSATIADGDVGQPYTPSAGIDSRASAQSASPEAIAGARALAGAGGRAQLASAGPTDVVMTDDGSQAMPGGGVMNTVSAPLDQGAAALAKAGKPQQMAQNTAALPSDDEILKMLDEVKPSLGLPAVSPAAGQTSTPAAPASGSAPHPAFDVQGFVDTYNRYRSFPAGVPLANSALQALIKMAPESYVLNTDGSLMARPGGPADPKQAAALEAGKTTGQKSAGLPYDAALKELEGNIALKNELAKQGLTLENGQIVQVPGFNQSVQDRSRADASGKVGPAIAQHAGTAAIDAQNAETEVTVDFGDGRGPIKTKLPRSTVLQMGNAAAPPGQTGSGATSGPRLSGEPVLQPGVGKGEDVAAEQFSKSRDEFTANQGAATNLRNFLEAANAVGTGRGTDMSATAAAWLKSAGIDPQKLSLADPAEVEKMRKAATQMIFAQIKGVSSRPAYQEFLMLEKANPNPELQPEANRAIAAALLGRMDWENSLHKAWDKDRRTSGRYSNFDFPAWTEANPMPGFQSNAYGSIPAIPDRGIVGKGQPAPKPDKAAIEQEMRRRGLLK